MKKHIIQLLSLTLLLGIFSPVNAQAVRNNVERAQDRNQIRNDKEIITRDRAEINQFRGYRQGMKKASANGNLAIAQGQHAKLVAAMQREVEQGKAKIAQANRELGQSRAEVRSSNREINRNRRTNKGPVVRADDRADRRDDVRDRRDDRNDLKERQARHARQQEILAAYRSIRVNGNPNAIAAFQAKQNLLDEFEQTMIRDMGENWEELGEDRRELREDRRETREDRRQR
ncbi:MAG: hypothetical protein AAGN35_15915 [Bacteroidota bacterium]